MKSRNTNFSDIDFIAGLLSGVAIGATLTAFFFVEKYPAESNSVKGNFLYDYQTLIIGSLALLVALATAVVGWRSHRTAEIQLQIARIQAQAALFNERMQIFQTTKDFLRPWYQNAVPDLNELWKLVDAWQRSKFLFDQSVTIFLRELWKDAVDAKLRHQIIANEVHGDREKAIEIQGRYFTKYLEGEADRPDVLVEAFKSMKIDEL
jgi:hypothetical protein